MFQCIIIRTSSELFKKPLAYYHVASNGILGVACHLPPPNHDPFHVKRIIHIPESGHLPNAIGIASGGSILIIEKLD